MNTNQKNALGFVTEYWDAYGRSPSMQEAASSIGVSVPGISKIFKRLAEMNMIEYQPGKQRSARPVNLEQQTLSKLSQQLEALTVLVRQLLTASHTREENSYAV